MTGRDYIASDYWDEIHRDGSDESAVGYPNLARSINKARYHVERHNVARALAAAGVPKPARVLDVGSGTGIWIDFWEQRGAAQIIGLDLAAAAVDRLSRRYPGHEFRQEDIASPNSLLPGAQDVVSAMSVLLHITDETQFEQALCNLASCVRKGGYLVLVEPVVVHCWWGPPFGADASSKARPLNSYTRVLQQMGFTIVELRPASCLLINVIDTRYAITFRVLQQYWALLTRFVGRRERLGRAVGFVLQALDLVATKMVPIGPSAKIIVARADA